MWSLQAALDGRRASILGVGHFTVPPDVVKEHDGPPSPNGTVTESWSSIRTIVVPHGITAVPRRSPIKARKRTPWNPAPERPVVVERGGTREWFTDRLFVESKQANLPAACSTSGIVHAVVVVLVLLLLASRAAGTDLTPRKLMDVSLRMPAMELLLLPVTVAPATTPKIIERPVSMATPPAPAPVRTIDARAAAPLKTPSSVEAEPTTIDDAPLEVAVAGAEIGGAIDGVTGGVVGATGSGLSVEPVQPPATPGPLRVGEGIARPRKIKHVRPVYPLPAMAARVGGNVLIEATIGADGRVHNARVVNSIAVLDQAALDAVRQWEFEPSRVNGVPVAVTMVIIVTFALL
jgi:protein TonB